MGRKIHDIQCVFKKLGLRKSLKLALFQQFLSLFDVSFLLHLIYTYTRRKISGQTGYLIKLHQGGYRKLFTVFSFYVLPNQELNLVKLTLPSLYEECLVQSAFINNYEDRTQMCRCNTVIFGDVIYGFQDEFGVKNMICGSQEESGLGNMIHGPR